MGAIDVSKGEYALSYVFAIAYGLKIYLDLLMSSFEVSGGGIHVFF
jgi:hypothetical protein